MQRRDELGGLSSSDASDEEDGGWLAQSRFDMPLRPTSGGSSPVRERRPLSEAGIEVRVPQRSDSRQFSDVFHQSAFPPPPADSPFNDPFSAEEDDVSKVAFPARSPNHVRS